MLTNQSLHAFLDPEVPLRRRFLKKTVLGVIALSVTRISFSSSIPSASTEAMRESKDFLSPKQFQVLEAICDRMIPAGDGLPGARELKIAGHLDIYFSKMDRPVAEQIAQLLDLFDVSPLLFDFKAGRFTSLAAPQQDEVLKSWASSRLEFRRTGFEALKRLAMSAYYGQEATWKMIGYDGPVI